MSYECTAPRDCECLLWKNGEANNICIETECDYLVEYYDINKCDCGSEKPPVLVGVGTARQYVEHKGDEQQIVWKNPPKYSVECESCGAWTDFYTDPDKAVEAWNTNRIMSPQDL